jgi:hypothetical protein
MAIARSKENQDINSNYCPVIRKVVTESNEIRRKLVELNHAVSRFEHRFRLYLSVNARNTIDATFSLKRDMDEWIQMRLHGNEDVMQKFKRLDSEFKSTLQSNKCKDESKFLFDLDEITADEANRFERKLKEDTTVILTRTTPNGHHIVTEPFNYTELDTGIDYEIKKMISSFYRISVRNIRTTRRRAEQMGMENMRLPAKIGILRYGYVWESDIWNLTLRGIQRDHGARFLQKKD